MFVAMRSTASILQRVVASQEGCLSRAVEGSLFASCSSSPSDGTRTMATSVVNKGLKAGPGGRHSISGVTATIFGSTGFVGRYLVNQLASGGTRCVLPNRSEEDDVQHLRLMGDLGQLYLIGPHFNVLDEGKLKDAIARSNVVINLIGAQHESWNWKFKHVHVDIAEKIARVTKEVGEADSFIHLSSLGAEPSAPSERLRSKYEGEQAVRAILPEATIIKSAPIVGEEDSFNNYFMESIHSKRVAMIDGGKRRFQPVWVKDVTEGIQRTIELPEASRGKTFYFGGPEVYTEWDYVGFVQKTLRTYDYRMSIPAELARLNVLPFDFIRNRVPFPIALHPLYKTADFVLDRTADLVVPDGVPTFADLGITPYNVTSGYVSDTMRWWRAGGYAGGEKPPSAA